jgi:hypothetical protein
MTNVSSLRVLPPYRMVSFYAATATTLTLFGKQGQDTGSLDVQLLDITTRAHRAAVDGANDDVERRLPTSPPIPEQIQGVINSAAAVKDLSTGVVHSLKQVIDKTRIVVDIVDKTAKVRVDLRL